MVIAMLAVVFWAATIALRRPPTFYLKAVSVPWEEQQEAGYLLERSVLDLHSDLQRHGPWQAVFTPDQVNGWLAVDLPAKFPNLLPPTVREPRVAVIDGRLHIACRYRDDRLAAVVSLELEVTLAAEPNTLAIRVCRARAGLLPLPLNRFVEQFSLVARDAQVTIRWGTLGGDPVALLALPPLDLETELPVRLTAIELRDGKILVTGDSGSPLLE